MDNDVVEIARKLISFDTSINPNNGTFPKSDCAEYTNSFAKNFGFEIINMDECKWGKKPYENQKIYPSLFYKQAKSDPSPIVLYLGHIDVVPVPEGEEWSTDPFQSEIINDMLTGRGSSDMKGAVAAFMSVFSEYQPIKGTVIIALCGDEEVAGQASMPLILSKLEENKLLPDYVINGEPSNKPIVITRRRGATWIKLSFPKILKEISGTINSIEYQSSQGNGTDTLHSAQFMLGVDTHAMFTAAKFSYGKQIISLKSSSVKENSVPSKVSMEYIDIGSKSDEKTKYYHNLTKFMKKLASLPSQNWPLAPSKYGISINPNNIIYEKNIISIIFDIRAMYKDENGHIDMLNLLLHHFNDIEKINGEILSSINPVNVDPKHILAKTVAKVAENNGIRIIDIGEKLGGASDTRYFTNLGIPGVEIGIIGENEHGPNESTSIKSMKQLKKVYLDIFKALIEIF